MNFLWDARSCVLLLKQHKKEISSQREKLLAGWKKNVVVAKKIYFPRLK
jgi:hypothetical protein